MPSQEALRESRSREWAAREARIQELEEETRRAQEGLARRQAGAQGKPQQRQQRRVCLMTAQLHDVHTQPISSPLFYAHNTNRRGAVGPAAVAGGEDPVGAGEGAAGHAG